MEKLGASVKIVDVLMKNHLEKIIIFSYLFFILNLYYPFILIIFHIYNINLILKN